MYRYIAPKKIKYEKLTIEKIEKHPCPEEYVIEILTYLGTRKRNLLEEHWFSILCDHYGFEPADDTELTQEEAMAIASNFMLFVQYMFRCERGFNWKLNWHHEELCRLLELMYLGKLEHDNLIVNIPPRYSKTQIVSIYFPAWTMGLVPDSNYILISYMKDVSENNTEQIRSLIGSDYYQRIFKVEFDTSIHAKSDFKTIKGGRCFATSPGGKITGYGAGILGREGWGGCIIIDDPHKAEDVHSDTKRNFVNNWIVGSCLSRRSGSYTPILIVMQRLHQMDLTGFCLPKINIEDETLDEESDEGIGEDFVHVNIPAILSMEDLIELDVPCESQTVLTGDEEADEYPLWPEKHSLKKLKRMRLTLPSLTFNGQYQQIPMGDGGTIFNEAWFREYETIPEDYKYKVFVIDTAQTEKTYSDYSVIMSAYVCNSGVYIDNIIRGKWASPKLRSNVEMAYSKSNPPPRKIYLEYKSSGIGLVQELKTGKINMPVVPIPRNAKEGDADKITRATTVAPWVESGYVYLPKNASWKEEFLMEVKMFPMGAHDDMVDTLMDLIAKEVVPKNGVYLPEMNLSSLPMGKVTFEKSQEKSYQNMFNKKKETKGLIIPELMNMTN